jgi:teichoic acid transport system permease protein
MALPAPAPIYYSRRVRDYLTELWRRREFAWYLGMGNLKARNASTALGLLWWVLNPILLGGVYFLVFGVIFESRRPDNFLAYLLSGMFVFHFTSQAMTGGANSILSNSRLLANLKFPRLILPISALLESTVGFLASLLVFYAIAIPTGQALPGYRLIYLPGALVVHLMFNLGLSCLTARLAVPFRDINNLIPYVNRIWLYLSPVIWPLSLLDNASDTTVRLVHLNPMFHIIEVYRAVLFNTPINLEHLLTAVAVSLGMGLIGMALFIKYEGNIVRYL